MKIGGYFGRYIEPSQGGKHWLLVYTDYRGHLPEPYLVLAWDHEFAGVGNAHMPPLPQWAK